MSFDTYNKCAYNCLYCFSYYQKSHSLGEGGAQSGGHDYQNVTPLTWVNPERIKRMFRLESGSKMDQQFFDYIRQRKVMQWGGLADQFDEYERKHGITLELMRFFKEINYPLSFSTKGIWWLEDPRYVELLRGQKNWNIKVSIINLDAERSRRMEKTTWREER